MSSRRPQNECILQSSPVRLSNASNKLVIAGTKKQIGFASLQKTTENHFFVKGRRQKSNT
jgi:hypothetical protein